MPALLSGLVVRDVLEVDLQSEPHLIFLLVSIGLAFVLILIAVTTFYLSPLWRTVRQLYLSRRPVQNPAVTEVRRPILLKADVDYFSFQSTDVQTYHDIHSDKEGAHTSTATEARLPSTSSRSSSSTCTCIFPCQHYTNLSNPLATSNNPLPWFRLWTSPTPATCPPLPKVSPPRARTTAVAAAASRPNPRFTPHRRVDGSG